MDYTDIEDGQPTQQGVYDVLIHNMDTGAEREAHAAFSMASGTFVLLEENLAHNEYVRAWQPLTKG